MNLKRVDIFQAKTIRGAPKMPTELRYCIEVIVASPVTDCGPSCPRSCGGGEGLSEPSENLLSEGWGCEKPTILSDRRQLLRPPLNCRASGFVQSLESQPLSGLVLDVEHRDDAVVAVDDDDLVVDHEVHVSAPLRMNV